MLGFWRPFVDGDHPSKVRTDLYLTDVHVNCFVWVLFMQIVDLKLIGINLFAFVILFPGRTLKTRRNDRTCFSRPTVHACSRSGICTDGFHTYSQSSNIFHQNLCCSMTKVFWNELCAQFPRW